MTDHFKFIPDPGFGPDQIPTGHLICNRCGRRVETGIMNVSSHWRDCYPEEYKKMLRMRRPGRHWDRSPVIISIRALPGTEQKYLEQRDREMKVTLNGKTYLYDKDMDDANQKYDDYRASQVRCDAIPLVCVDDGQEMNLSHFIDDYGISGKDARQVMRLGVGQTIVVQDMSVTRTR